MNKNNLPIQNKNTVSAPQQQQKMKEAESPLINKSISKSELNNSNINVDAIVRNGEARTYLNNTAKAMLDDMKEFSNQSVEIFNKVNTNVTQDFHMFLKHSSEHKKKIDKLVTDQSERMRKMEVLKSMRERFASGNN